ncbi:adenosine receptor A2b-like [Ruditapes philippinarum]|uniref:adenosine receptor A2b-like n=1 Tax=Ruditapes philippinarum TaxID=129788 RepID=UPI00295AD155|nr:adenosine receptor A2b-like [Ruditapes philippinarum]
MSSKFTRRQPVKSKRLRFSSPTNESFANLNFCDIPIRNTSKLFSPQKQHDSNVGALSFSACQSSPTEISSLLSIFVACLGSSCISLMLISCERFLSIMYPLKMIGLQNRRKVIVIFLEWSAAIISSLIPVFGWNNYRDSESLQCFDRNIWPQEYIQWINGQFVGLIILNIICYAIVVRVAINKARQRSARVSVAQRVKGAKDLQNVITMVIVLGVFALCWLPYVTMFIVVQFWDTSQSDYIRRVSLIPGLLNSSLNWIIYGYRNMEYRKAFKKTLRKLLCRDDNAHVTMIS